MHQESIWDRRGRGSRHHGLAGRRHGGGFGHFAGGFMGGRGMGGHGFRTGRKLGSGELQLVILALLAEKPQHGYEIIKALEERSGGFYAPSPGMVYPALTYLEETDYATVEVEGTKKLYRITVAGETYLAQNRETADAILTQLAWIGKKMGRVREVFGGEGRTEDGEDPASRIAPELRQAWRELRGALREKIGAPDEEHRRITEILAAALEQIRKGS